jgi:ankyrin repeat protein
LLLKNGAEPNIKDEIGKTPLQWAIERDYQQIVDLLCRYGGRA